MNTKSNKENTDKKKQEEIFYILSVPYTKSDLQTLVKTFELKGLQITSNPKIKTISFSREERARIR